MEARKRSSLCGARVLVTGASGFIGSNLVRALARLGADVTGLSRSVHREESSTSADSLSAHRDASTDDEGALGRTPRFVVCDLRDADRTRAVVRGLRPQFVFHLAAHPDGRESGEQTLAVLDNNIGALIHLLEALRELPAVSLIYGDSAKVYGNTAVPYRFEQPLEPLSAYAVSKVSGWGFVDLYRRVHGIQAFGLRPTLVYGPGQRFNLFSYLLGAIRPGNAEITLDGGAQTRDPIYIDDCIDAFIVAAEHAGVLSGRNLPLGGGREVSVAQLAELTIGLMGGDQKVISQPVNVRPTETMRSWCDNAEITAEIGWKPSVTLEEGILRTARALGLHPAPALPVAAALSTTASRASGAMVE